MATQISTSEIKLAPESSKGQSGRGPEPNPKDEIPLLELLTVIAESKGSFFGLPDCFRSFQPSSHCLAEVVHIQRQAATSSRELILSARCGLRNLVDRPLPHTKTGGFSAISLVQLENTVIPQQTLKMTAVTLTVQTSTIQ